ncbi:MAG: hypothetical protein LH650_15000 [Chloroflexi bacterium]|nr:hypothetical protein [Chloroflexota bacterium]
MTADVRARTALGGVVLVPVERCPCCHRPLGLDGEQMYRGHHYGCDVPPRSEWWTGATGDFLIAPPNARRVGP